MSRHYTADFKAEAVKQVMERGFTVVEVAERVGIPKHTLYAWVQAARRAGGPADVTSAPAASDSLELRRLRAEVKRLTEERDILKRALLNFKWVERHEG